MDSAIARFYITVKDVAGRYAKTLLSLVNTEYDPNGTIEAQLVAILVKILKGKITLRSVAVSAAQSDTPTSGPFCTIEDKTTLDMVTVDGQTVSLRIPTPSTNIFQTDLDELDLTDANLITLIGAFVSYTQTKEGVAFDHCSGGRRIRHKQEKKGGF